jgi:hypothetical protein
VNSTSITTTSGTSTGIAYVDTFAAAAGSALYRPLSIAYTINNSGAQTGNTTGILLNATQTNLNGMTHNLMDLQVGGSSRFRVNNAGDTIITGSLIIAPSSNVELQVTSTGVQLGNAITDTHNITGSLNVTGSVSSAGIVSIGRTTTSQAVIQRPQTPAGAYSFILASGTGIVDTFPYTMTDAHGATLEMRAGPPASDQYAGGILITANGNTSPLGEGNAIVFKNRTGTNTYTERMRIKHDGKVGIGTSSPASLLDVNGGDIQTSNSIKIGDSLQIEQRSLTRTSRDTITASTTANTTCDEATSQSPYTFRSMHIKYNIQDSTGGNYRAGTVMAITNGSGTITSIDTATSDIGNTSSVVLTVVLTNSGQNMTLEVNNGLGNDVTVVTEYTML